MKDCGGLAETIADWESRLSAAGFESYKRIKADYFAERFGNAVAEFHAGPIILRLVRDRGEEFLSVAMTPFEDEFFPIDDIDLAMRWKSLDEIVSREEPERLDGALARLAGGLPILCGGIEGQTPELFRLRIRKASKERQDAFLKMLTSRNPT